MHYLSASYPEKTRKPTFKKFVVLMFSWLDSDDAFLAEAS